MMTLLNPIRLALVASMLATLMLVVLASQMAPAYAQQGAINPTASSVKEEQLLNALQSGGGANAISGRVSIPDAKSGTLIQPGGTEWRDFHEKTLPRIGAVAILGMLAVLILYYVMRGRVRISGGPSGKTITRFNAFERFVHWLTATCFIILAISGLNVSFGKQLLLPLMGAGAFADWSQLAKYAHNYLSFPFTIGVILMLLMWVAGNIPSQVDLEWIKRGGGLFGQDHPPAPRFNAGQKLIYWIVVLGGGAVAITGYLLMFPFYATDVSGMQTAQMIHGIVAVLFVAVMLAHIYIGSLGMEGAFSAMGSGEVDVNWAKDHHSLWVEKEQARKEAAPSQPVATPAE
ncbi:MAG: formate dehydrogenase subunit gamma [Proteobacteria bacterium]|nr:formate dehydrogenase subunit gamma [Pseudomonadota bacterium]